MERFQKVVYKRGIPVAGESWQCSRGLFSSPHTLSCSVLAQRHPASCKYGCPARSRWVCHVIVLDASLPGSLACPSFCTRCYKQGLKLVQFRKRFLSSGPEFWGALPEDGCPGLSCFSLHFCTVSPMTYDSSQGLLCPSCIC